jgi:hypothetical protein
LLLPILIYALFILITGIKINNNFTLFITPIALMVLLVVLSYSTFRISNFTFVLKRKWINWPELNIKKPFWCWPIFYLISEQRIALLIVKIVSIFFFKAVLCMFADVGNDVRVYLTAILAVALSHAVLIFNLIKFNASYLSFTKSLPIAAVRNLVNSTIIYFLILVPEFIMLGWLTNFSIVNLLQCILFGIAVMLGLQLIVYLIKANMERYLKYILFFFFASMMGILFGYAMLYSIILITVSGLMFLWRYPKIDLKMIA